MVIFVGPEIAIGKKKNSQLFKICIQRYGLRDFIWTKLWMKARGSQKVFFECESPHYLALHC